MEVWKDYQTGKFYAIDNKTQFGNITTTDNS